MASSVNESFSIRHTEFHILQNLVFLRPITQKIFNNLGHFTLLFTFYIKRKHF